MIQMTCAVCKIGKNSTVCEICGFSDNGVTNRKFPITEDANYWLETIVKPYRQQINLDINDEIEDKETLFVLEKMRSILSRADFISTIGYDGSIAIIDGSAKRLYGSLSTQELLKKGLYKQAYASAVYSGKINEKRLIAEAYSKISGNKIEVSALKKLFGIFPVIIKRSKVL